MSEPTASTAPTETSLNGASAHSDREPRDLGSIDAVMAALAAQRYIADRGLATALYLALNASGPCCWKASRESARRRSRGCWRIAGDRADPLAVLRGH